MLGRGLRRHEDDTEAVITFVEDVATFRGRGVRVLSCRVLLGAL
jgi:hypothetical protein